MGCCDRRRRDRSVGSAGLALVAVAVLLVACGGPRTVSLADLAFEQEAFHGEEVVTNGMVVEFDEDDGAIRRHLVIQDSEQNRVELRPDEEAESFIGSYVRVRGQFEFDPQQGRLLHVEDIESASD